MVDSERERPVIVVDGPAGTGKSTVCKLFAEKAGYSCLDTGALYRAVAWRALSRGLSVDNEGSLAELCHGIEVVVAQGSGGMLLFADGRNIESLIRTEEMGMAASRVSRLAGVRAALLPLQRKAGIRGGIIAEGRDMGTVVFPDAEIKIFLDADPEERALRRYRELIDRGEQSDFNEVLHDICRRDTQDRTRAVAPLKPADDAIIIDTTLMDIVEVVEMMVDIYQERTRAMKESTVL